MLHLADLHTHTPLCRHAAGTPEEYAEGAKKAGLAVFGVSDHFPQTEYFQPGGSMSVYELPQYRGKWMTRVRKALEESGIEVLYATEMDYAPGYQDPVRALYREESKLFDYRISSVHFAAGFTFDDPGRLDLWQEKGTDRVWDDYAQLINRMVDEGDFEIIGHLDLPKKFSFYPQDRTRFGKAVMPALEMAAKKGICIEINTAGLQKPVREIYPSLDLLKEARKAGVGLTFGSDSHTPKNVGADFDRAVELAKAAGYRAIHFFRKHERFDIGLD